MYTGSVHFSKDGNDAWIVVCGYILAWTLGIHGACTAIEKRIETYYGNKHLDDIMSMSLESLTPYCGSLASMSRSCQGKSAISSLHENTRKQRIVFKGLSIFQMPMMPIQCML